MPLDPPINQKRKLHWYQFSLRTLLIFMTLFAIVCSWFAVKIQQAKKQRAEIERIDRLGGNVYYGYQCDETGKPIHSSVILHPDGTSQIIRCPESAVPQCLRDLLSDDFFYMAASIELFDLKTIDELKNIDTCKKLKLIYFMASPGESLTDEEISDQLQRSFPQSMIKTNRVIEWNCSKW